MGPQYEMGPWQKMMDEAQERVKLAYRDNHVWLAEAKAKYEPENLFCVSQNIKPKA